MMNNPENTTLWFVHSSYTPAGRPKAETAVMQYAEGKYLHCIIPDNRLDAVLVDLTAKAEEIRAANKRLAPVDIHLSRGREFYDNAIVWLYVGAQHLALQRVKDIIK